MTSASEDGFRGTLTRVWGCIRGPRFVDLPIRLLALIMGLTVLVPGSFEIDEPRYMALLVFAYGLIILAPFLPLATVFASTGLSLVFVAFYPDLENMFPEALIFATAVLLSHRRWIGAAIATVGLVSYLVTSTELGAYDGGIEGFIDLGFGWLTYSLIGLAAGLVELRIQREIIRRERAAVEHQKAVESMRARFTSDMHDTISNSLATESAIIRTMARETASPDSDRLLAELALVNAEATKRLRQLVVSLSSGETQDSRIPLHADVRQLATAIDSGCSAGSVALSTHVGDLPKYSSSALGQNFRAILLELATNVIRYSTPGTPAALDVEMRHGSVGRADLVCRSVNEAPAGLSQTPRSLSRRAAAVNGTCRVLSAEDNRVTVEVSLPVRYVSTPSASAVDGSLSEGIAVDAGKEVDVHCDHDDGSTREETSGATRAAASAKAEIRRETIDSTDPTDSTGTTSGDGTPGNPEPDHTARRKNRVEA